MNIVTWTRSRFHYQNHKKGESGNHVHEPVHHWQQVMFFGATKPQVL
jgi:hypothetical protein